MFLRWYQNCITDCSCKLAPGCARGKGHKDYRTQRTGKELPCQKHSSKIMRNLVALKHEIVFTENCYQREEKWASHQSHCSLLLWSSHFLKTTNWKGKSKQLDNVGFDMYLLWRVVTLVQKLLLKALKSKETLPKYTSVVFWASNSYNCKHRDL